MWSTLSLLLMFAAGAVGYLAARGYVKRRLRFVDAIRSPLAPVIAGVGAFVLGWPFAFLPLVTVGTAVLFGIGVGVGTASGARAITRGDTTTHYLP